ncbi:MAG: alpha-xylosidase, partial [Clostridia bacterium]|nr:alpha-xylosidase [Clostridia bacterium]
AVEASKSGVPVMRAMALEFEKDKNAICLDTQYMLGESILVAPVFTESGDADFYLPEGKWTHLLTNEERNGGKWYSENYDFFSLPLFVRENTVLPMGYEISKPDYDYADNIALHVFNLTDKAERTVYDTDAKPVFTVKCEKKGNTLSFLLDKLPKVAKIILRNIHSVSSVAGADYESCELGISLVLKGNEITVKL